MYADDRTGTFLLRITAEGGATLTIELHRRLTRRGRRPPGRLGSAPSGPAGGVPAAVRPRQGALPQGGPYTTGAAGPPRKSAAPASGAATRAGPGERQRRGFVRRVGRAAEGSSGHGCFG